MITWRRQAVSIAFVDRPAQGLTDFANSMSTFAGLCRLDGYQENYQRLKNTKPKKKGRALKGLAGAHGF
jgi:hypothetical protein